MHCHCGYKTCIVLYSSIVLFSHFFLTGPFYVFQHCGDPSKYFYYSINRIKKACKRSLSLLKVCKRNKTWKMHSIEKMCTKIQSHIHRFCLMFFHEKRTKLKKQDVKKTHTHTRRSLKKPLQKRWGTYL